MSKWRITHKTGDPPSVTVNPSLTGAGDPTDTCFSDQTQSKI